ncbi:MAG: RNA polymerase sigma-70 factor [Pedobacter sp.]|jgi:RNA polymerase sigma-70 factor (ECF subfamily)
MSFPEQCNKISEDFESLPLNKGCEQLFKAYYSRLCYFSFQLIRDKVIAEDIVQEAFFKYWNHRDELALHNADAVKNFLYSTVRNASLNMIRHEKVVSGYLELQDSEPIEDFNIIHSIIRSEVLAELHMALETLPERCQRISKMGYLAGMKNSEIAEKLGVSVNTVKTQKKRGLQLLRLVLKPEVYTLFLFLLKQQKL